MSAKGKGTGRRSTIRFGDKNEELADLVKLAVGEAIKQAIPALVEDVVERLTNKTQALVDAQVAEIRSEIVAMKADVSKCMDGIEKGENSRTEADNRLSALVNKPTAQQTRMEDKISDLEDRSRRDNVRLHGEPENPEMINALAYLSDAIPRWFPELGPVEIMRAHRMGAPRTDMTDLSLCTYFQVAAIHQQRQNPQSCT